MSAVMTELTGRGVRLGGGETIDLFAGSMHYWRIERKRWGACLSAMRELGLELVTTYVPWSVHERGPGRFDFERGERDLGAFLDEVARAGMRAILRPGPHVNAELTGFGFPDRVLRRKECQALSGRGTPVWVPAPPQMFPAPSYASEAFREEATAWLAAAGEVIAPRLHPEGPVIALQVDNEMPLFFRLGAYDHDYHPDALSWWRDFAGSDQREMEAPRAWDPGDAGRAVRWVKFKEEYAARALGWLSGALEEAGLGKVARFHNSPPMDPTLANLPRAAAAVGGVCGADFYHAARDYPVVRRRSLYLAGSARPLPFAVEVGQGGPPWLSPMSEEDQEQVLLGLLASGVRAFNLYMAVERERWYGAPIAPDGARRPRAERLEALLAALAELQWTSLRRRAAVAVILSRAEARWAIASSAADPLTPVLTDALGLGPGGYAELALDDRAAIYGRWMEAVARALDLAAIPYALVDEEAPDEALEGYRAVILPTLERVDRRTWRRLRELAKRGVHIIAGPERPTRDELGEPLGDDARLPRRCGLIRQGSLDDIDGLADDIAAVALAREGSRDDVGKSARAVELSADEDDETWLADREEVDVSLFEDEGGAPRVLFCGNRSASSVDTDIDTPAATLLVDVVSGERFASGGENTVRVALAPFQWRMLAIEID